MSDKVNTKNRKSRQIGAFIAKFNRLRSLFNELQIASNVQLAATPVKPAFAARRNLKENEISSRARPGVPLVARLPEPSRLKLNKPDIIYAAVEERRGFKEKARKVKCGIIFH